MIKYNKVMNQRLLKQLILFKMSDILANILVPLLVLWTISAYKITLNIKHSHVKHFYTFTTSADN